MHSHLSFIIILLLVNGAMQQLRGRSFRQVALSAFGNAAVRVESAEGKVLHQPGVEGLHMLLDGCRVEASGEDVSADVVSVDSVKKVYDMIGWDLDYSFARDEMLTLRIVRL